MAVSYVGAALNAVPSGTASGDLMVAFCSMENAGTGWRFTAPSGWSTLLTWEVTSGPSNSSVFQVFYKTSAGEKGSLGFTTSGHSVDNLMQVVAYRGVTAAPTAYSTNDAAGSGYSTTGHDATGSAPSTAYTPIVYLNAQSPSGAPAYLSSAGQTNRTYTSSSFQLGVIGDMTRRLSTPPDATVTSTSAITGLWRGITVYLPDNQAPTAPTITAPNGGETVNTSTTITWTAGSDPDADPISYDLDYSLDNGASWTSIVVGTSGTSYTWDTSAVANSTACLVRARTRDNSGAVSAYDASNATFTIFHNAAPNAPTGLNPSGSNTIDLTVTQRFSWTFSDPNAGDTQSKFDLQYRIGTGAWTTVTQSTPNAYYDMPANTLSAANYEWQVRTYDSSAVVGPWSASAFFTASTPPSGLSITAPTSGSTVGTSTGTITWSDSAQDSYQVRKVADNAGAADTSTIYYDTGEVVSSTARNAALTFPVNGRYEHLQVRIKSGGLWSSWADVRVLVSYTPPAVPTLTISGDSTNARMYVSITDPTPTGSQPTVSSHDIYRRISGDGTSGIRLAAAFSGAMWTDLTPGSRTSYEYQVIANGSNSTNTPSAWTS